MATKKEELHEDDLVYYRHPNGKLEEMTRAEAAKLEKKEGGTAAADPADIAPGGNTGAPAPAK